MNEIISKLSEMQMQMSDVQKAVANLQDATKQLLDVSDVAKILKTSKANVYRLLWEKRLPHYKDASGGRRVWFKRSDIENYLCGVYVPTQTETTQKAIDYVVKKGGAK